MYQISVTGHEPSYRLLNRIRNPKWQEADQLAIYKHDCGVEPGSTEKQLQQMVRVSLEPMAPSFQVQHPTTTGPWCLTLPLVEITTQNLTG